MKNKDKAFSIGVKDARKAKEKIREINEYNEKNGKPLLTKEQERKVRAKVVKQESKRRKIKALIAALGLTSAISIGEGVALLNLGNDGVDKSKHEITIDAGEVEKNIKIKNIGDGNVFIDGIKVNQEDLGKDQEATLEENVEKEVEKLKTSVEVIEYLKTVYANEYNEEYNTNVNKENVEITKNREGISLVEDKDENGNDIIRNINKNDPEDIKTVDIESGVVTAKVYDENKNMLSIQQVLNDGKNNYKGIEDSENNVLIKVGKILDKGIDWSTSIDQKDTDEKIKQNYKKQFIDSIVEFKENQIEEIKTESLEEER